VRSQSLDPAHGLEHPGLIKRLHNALQPLGLFELRLELLNLAHDLGRASLLARRACLLERAETFPHPRVTVRFYEGG
jgi:hypothetical protein